MTDDEPDGGDDLAIRSVVLLMPIILTARLLDIWLPKPLSWPLSMLAWMLLIYWLPTRTSFNLRRWLIIVAVAVLLVLIVAILKPDLL